MPASKYFQLHQGMTPLPTAPAPVSDISCSRPKPLLRLRVNDLKASGAVKFLSSIDVSEGLQLAVSLALENLYPYPSTDWPGTRSITLVLESMPGVAYTRGSDLDSDHKEIHFSTDYINSILQSRLHDEILGVICHEVVHCWQYNGEGTAPSGLIEGIADYVRLVAGFAPPHWKREKGGDWDAGYQHTGYFLEYLEKKFGAGTVVAINRKLKRSKYDEAQFWIELFGVDVHSLWDEYTRSLDTEL